MFFKRQSNPFNQKATLRSFSVTLYFVHSIPHGLLSLRSAPPETGSSLDLLGNIILPATSTKYCHMEVRWRPASLHCTCLAPQRCYLHDALHELALQQGLGFSVSRPGLKSPLCHLPAVQWHLVHWFQSNLLYLGATGFLKSPSEDLNVRPALRISDTPLREFCSLCVKWELSVITKTYFLSSYKHFLIYPLEKKTHTQNRTPALFVPYFTVSLWLVAEMSLPPQWPDSSFFHRLTLLCEHIVHTQLLWGATKKLPAQGLVHKSLNEN